ncbi:MAG TPA: serine hydrolase domain-containing protein [Ktedonobacteraceae bacterium]
MDLNRPLQHALKVIDRWLEYNAYADEHIVGLSVGIVYKDSVIFSKGYGYANVEQKIKASENTCYRIASISKIFTTVAVLQLWEQGKLRLDDSVQQYLSWFTSSDERPLGQITIRQLLTHTAGLDRDGDTTQWVGDFPFPELDVIQQHIAAGATVYEPLEHWKYSNYGFTLLGAVIEQVSGVSYETYMRQHIIERLGLTHTAPEFHEDMAQYLALGYSRSLPGQEKKPFPHITTNAMASATGFASNVLDLCHFIQAQFVGQNELLREETKREMRRIQWLREGEGSDWCLGLETWKVNNRRLYGHSGGFPGYKSRFGFDPESEIGVVVFTNSIDARPSDLANSIWESIDYFIACDEQFEPAEQPVEHLEDYVQTYRNIWGDLDVVAINNQQLLLFYPGPTLASSEWYQLRYETADHFRIVRGSSFGHIGEIARFEWQDGKVERVVVGSDPFTRLEKE